MQNLAANLKQPNLRAKILKDKSKFLQALDDYDMNNNTVTGRGGGGGLNSHVMGILRPKQVRNLILGQLIVSKLLRIGVQTRGLS